LYQRYVKGVSPHQTFIAVLTETGIVGAIGFGVFLVALLRLTFGGVRMARDRPAKARGLFVATAVLYCIVSMFFTDAWLWGQGIVLLGIVTGVMLAHRKMNENVPGETAAARRSSSVGSGVA
jgi:O-antigen ligase